MTIQVGDRLPQVTFRVMTPDGPQAKTTDDIFKGRRVALVAVPGAFTPTCHRNHLPGFIAKSAELKAKGIEAVAVTAVNDVFVMNEWKKASPGADEFIFLADGSAEFAKAVGLSMDAAGHGLGTRSQRYAMIVDDGVVTALNVEDAPGKADVSSAENLLKGL